MPENDEIVKHPKQDKEVSNFDFTICPNCGETEVGKFCPNCGQLNKDFNKPIKEILSDLFGSVNLDVRIINTIRPFFFKPGFLSNEYFKGRRQRYVPPMRLYLFFSIIFFFLAQYSSIKTMKRSDFSNVIADSSSVDIAMNIDKSIPDSIITLNSFDKAELKEKLLNDSTATDSDKKIVLSGFNAFENWESFIAKFVRNLSYVLFLLMPVFALILAMILWSSRMLYVRHLIFSINFHSFVFGLSSVVIVLSMILPVKISGYFLYLLWGIPLYLMIGISRFYGRKKTGSFFKATGALLLYSVVILIVLGIIFYFTVREFA